MTRQPGHYASTSSIPDTSFGIVLTLTVWFIGIFRSITLPLIDRSERHEYDIVTGIIDGATRHGVLAGFDRVISGPEVRPGASPFSVAEPDKKSSADLHFK
jgi:hypothetical protein